MLAMGQSWSAGGLVDAPGSSPRTTAGVYGGYPGVRMHGVRAWLPPWTQLHLEENIKPQTRERAGG